MFLKCKVHSVAFNCVSTVHLIPMCSMEPSYSAHCFALFTYQSQLSQPSSAVFHTLCNGTVML